LINQVAISAIDWGLWTYNVREKESLEKELGVNTLPKFGVREGDQNNFWFLKNWVSKEFAEQEE